MRSFSYVKFGDHATNLPSTVRFANNGVFNESIQYKYDSMGNIIEVFENGISAYRYEYDMETKGNLITYWLSDRFGGLFFYLFISCWSLT